MSIWYQLDSTEVLQQLDTNTEHGLSQPEVAHRLKKYGFNELTEKPGESLWQILWKQLTAVMVVVLIVARPPGNWEPGTRRLSLTGEFQSPNSGSIADGGIGTH